MKKNAALIGLALALLATAYVLARCGEERLQTGGGATEPKAVKQIEYPREKARRKLRTPATTTTTTATAKTPVVGRDKLGRALGSPGKDGALIVEVNAIRHSPIAEKIFACEMARKGDGANSLDTLKEALGVDVTEDVDRVGFDKDVLAVSGFFQNLKLPPEVGEGVAYGDGGRVFTVKDEGGKNMVVGKVGDELLVTGFDEAQVKAAIDRAEGRAIADSALPQELVGGEVYGMVGKAFLTDLLSNEKDPTAQRLLSVVKQTRLQVAVDDAAALSVDIEANSPEEGKDLGKALGGLISMARQQAQANGDDELAGLLDQGAVNVRDDGTVAVDVAVPGDTLLKFFGCDKDGKPL